MESKIYSILAVAFVAAVAFTTLILGGKAQASSIKSEALLGFLYTTVDNLKAPLLIYPDSHHILSAH